MILPNKVIRIEESLLYKALEWFHNSKYLIIKSKKDINYACILYALEYIDYKVCEGAEGIEIKIFKIK